jgi:putative transposase
MTKELLKNEDVSLDIALKAFGLSKSSYYYQPNPSKDKRSKQLDNTLVYKLKELTGYELVYGYRKVTKLFKQYNHKKIYRHMKALKMLQPKKLKKRKTTRLDISCPITSNVRWEGDLTYVFDGNRLNYLFVIVDAFDKEPIGDCYGLRCRAKEAIVSLEDAVKLRFGSLNPSANRRVNLRVDQGSQYISKNFKARAKELGIRLEYCGINCPDDKPYVESFFARYKCEEVYRNEYSSFMDAFLAWMQYKHWYKTERIHQGLGWQTIPEFKHNKGLQQIAGYLEYQKIGA